MSPSVEMIERNRGEGKEKKTRGENSEGSEGRVSLKVEMLKK